MRDTRYKWNPVENCQPFHMIIGFINNNLSKQMQASLSICHTTIIVSNCLGFETCAWWLCVRQWPDILMALSGSHVLVITHAWPETPLPHSYLITYGHQNSSYFQTYFLRRKKRTKRKQSRRWLYYCPGQILPALYYGSSVLLWMFFIGAQFLELHPLVATCY